MCVVMAPAVMMGVMAATTAASAGVGILSAMQQSAAAKAEGQAQANALNYQAQVANNNAKIQQMNVDATTQAEATAEQQSRQKTALMIGAERAAMGANGIDPNTGSALDVQSGTAQAGEMDALTIRSNAAREAFGFQVQGMSDTAQGQLDTAGANSALMGGQLGQQAAILSGASSVLGNANSFASKWQLFSMKAG